MLQLTMRLGNTQEGKAASLARLQRLQKIRAMDPTVAPKIFPFLVESPRKNFRPQAEGLRKFCPCGDQL